MTTKREPRVGDVWMFTNPKHGDATCWRIDAMQGADVAHATVVHVERTGCQPPGYEMAYVGHSEYFGRYSVLSVGSDDAWTLVSEAPAEPPPEALPPSAGRDFLAAVHAKAVERFAPQPEAPRSEPADWRDAYPVGMRVEVRSVDTWLAGTITDHTVRGMNVRMDRDSGGDWPLTIYDDIRPLRTEPARETTFTIAQDFRHAKDAARRIDEAVTAEFEKYFRELASWPVPFVPVMPAAGVLPTDIPFGPGTPAAGIRACPFCQHHLHTAHTSAVLRCAACGWAGTAEQRAAACEPVIAESRFKVGDRVRVWRRDVYEWCGGAAPGQLMEREADGMWLYVDTMLGRYDSEPEARSAVEADIWSEAEWDAMSAARWKAEAEKRLRPAEKNGTLKLSVAPFRIHVA